ncbi:hypothetical protein CERZMDRAFT_80730 [Cercospora zeae-maydis SCOH1-5]|uniref:F-box domain-containing protein n=1 Tax=Cercospora zeae-maydis SCOH1-5 TaxID=717836 RepID=A0A6A6FT53_9PEZI|nr:hypothetical protein CERZMDRAFT_80730 [Cercospora zeae-maydis SCOH1-5]
MGQFGSSATARGSPGDGFVSRAVPSTGRDLPEEMLGLIIESVVGHQQLEPNNEDCWQHIQTLRSLCLTSTQFRRLAEPFLYRTILWPAGNPRSACRARRLLRTIVARPELRDCVREIHIGVDGSLRVEARDTTSQDLRNVDWKAYRTATRELSTLSEYGIKHRELLRDLRAGQGYASLTLLLTVCKKVRHIDLKLWPGWKETTTGRLLQAAGTFSADSLAPGFIAPYSLLPELTQYTLAHGDSEGCTLIEDVQNLLCHPSLLTLRGRSLSLQEDELRDFSVRRSNLRVIELTHSLLDAAGIAEMLAVCPKLENLSIHWGSLTVGDCIIDWPSIGNSLRHSGRRLSTLRLEPRDAFQFDEASFDTSYPPLGDLTPLSMLRVLQLPAMCLAGLNFPRAQGFDIAAISDLLPSSLQEIEILEFRAKSIPLQELVFSAMSSARLGNLGKIVFGATDMDFRTLRMQGWVMWHLPETSPGRIVLSRRKTGET